MEKEGVLMWWNATLPMLARRLVALETAMRVEGATIEWTYATSGPVFHDFFVTIRHGTRDADLVQNRPDVSAFVEVAQ